MDEKKDGKFLKFGIAMMIIPTIIVLINLIYRLAHKDLVTFWTLVITVPIIILPNFIGSMARKSILKRQDLDDDFKEKFAVQWPSKDPKMIKLWRIVYVLVMSNAMFFWIVNEIMTRGEFWIFFLWLFFILLAVIFFICAYLIEKPDKKV